MLPRSSRAKALEIAGEALDVCAKMGRSSVSGTLRGRELEFSVDSGERRWSVQVATWQLPLAVDVTRRHVYLEVGADYVRADDPAFDERFQMDAAPAELARAALDEALRRRLVALDPDRLTLIGDAVRLEKDYAWYFAEETDIRAAIDLTVTFAERADAVCRNADAAALEAVRRGAPYRAVPDPEAAAAEQAQQRTAITAVAERHRRRRRYVNHHRRYAPDASASARVIALAVVLGLVAILSGIYAGL